MSEGSESEVQELQVKVAFLEEAIVKLSDEYYAQQKELQKLKQQLLSLNEKLTAAQDSSGGEGESDDERPPHY